MEIVDKNSPEARSEDVVAENVRQLGELFPELLTEGPLGPSINVDVLKQLVGEATVSEIDEKYGLSWFGKRNARKMALTPSLGALLPRPDESEDWDNTKNLMIEGDNLEVLKLLQKSYSGKVKLIYIDPPYNTGKDFVYPDNYQDNIKNYLELTGQTEEGRKTTSNTESNGRFHTDWLNMMYPRLKLAQSLLRPDGLLVVHIDENELSRLLVLLEELFGLENEVGVCIWDKRNPKGDSRGISYQHEYVVFYAKDSATLFSNAPLIRNKKNAGRMLAVAKKFVSESTDTLNARVAYKRWVKEQKDLTAGESAYQHLSDDGRSYRLVSMAWPNKKKAPDSYFIPLVHPVTGEPCPIPERGWRNPPETMRQLLDDGLIEFGVDATTQPQRRYFLDENVTENVPSLLPYGGSDDRLFSRWGIEFDNPKPYEFVRDVISWTTSDQDIVVDFFAGSGTTGHAVWDANRADGANRSFVLIQIPMALDGDAAKSVADITKVRLQKAREDYAETHDQMDTGFRVFKLAESNIRAWNPLAEDLEGTLRTSEDHLVEGRSELDVLYEILLKRGLDLCIPIETKEIAGHHVNAVGGGVLFACLDSQIAQPDVEALAEGIVAWREELSVVGDVNCIFRDSAFGNDVAKSNMSSILEQAGFTRIQSL